MTNTKRITVAKFGPRGSADDGTADVFVDGANVGYIERQITEEFVSASLRAKKQLVAGYSVTLWDERAEGGESFDTRAQARAYVAAVLARLGTLASHAVKS